MASITKYHDAEKICSANLHFTRDQVNLMYPSTRFKNFQVMLELSLLTSGFFLIHLDLDLISIVGDL